MVPPDPFLNAVFVALVLGFGVAIRFRDRLPDRRYVGYLLVAVVIVANAISFPLLPVPLLHKYTDPVSDAEPLYDVYVIDADGRELEVPPSVFDPASPLFYGSALLRTDRASQCYQGWVLLEAAHRHRAAVMSRSILARVGAGLSPPPPLLGDGWTRAELRRYDTFVGIRVYQSTARLKVPPRAKGYRTTDRTLALEVIVGDATADPSRGVDHIPLQSGSADRISVQVSPPAAARTREVTCRVS
ncbi:MAG: hypothetical protein ABEI98_05885 [Halorhabdus sp.]